MSNYIFYMADFSPYRLAMKYVMDAYHARLYDRLEFCGCKRAFYGRCKHRPGLQWYPGAPVYDEKGDRVLARVPKRDEIFTVVNDEGKRVTIKAGSGESTYVLEDDGRKGRLWIHHGHVYDFLGTSETPMAHVMATLEEVYEKHLDQMHEAIEKFSSEMVEKYADDVEGWKRACDKVYDMRHRGLAFKLSVFQKEIAPEIPEVVARRINHEMQGASKQVEKLKPILEKEERKREECQRKMMLGEPINFDDVPEFLGNLEERCKRAENLLKKLPEVAKLADKIARSLINEG